MSNTQLHRNISENVEEYLEALWISEELGYSIAKLSWIAKRLDVAPSSVFEMFKKLEIRSLVNYYPYRGIQMTEKGRQIARQVVRNHRLIEVLMKQTLSMHIDETVACGVEHHMTQPFTDALCTLLKHPRTCPHANVIPSGTCCLEHERS
ncbi:MAG: metal-dependent transcriptional regulator [Candidatus Bathyarchaeota archaeon]|nr:metal-dependent transcriptional regulator [Candidatus Bathyarchaeota archaeon]